MHEILAQLQDENQSVNTIITTNNISLLNPSYEKLNPWKRLFWQKIGKFVPKLQDVINNIYSIDHLLETV